MHKLSHLGHNWLHHNSLKSCSLNGDYMVIKAAYFALFTCEKELKIRIKRLIDVTVQKS